VARAVTVRVYQDAVESLADNESDLSVVQLLESVAEEIRQIALNNARQIVPNLPESFLDIDVGKDTKGLFVRVEPDGQGRLSSYLTWKEFREHAWLEPAVAEVIGFGSIRF
jgi:hypothetical protein